MTGNGNRALPVRSRYAAPQFLRDEGGSAGRRVTARVVGSDAGGSGRGHVVASVRGSRLRIAPCSAQHRHARACGNCQHDRKGDCSEHRSALAVQEGNEYARSDCPGAGSNQGICRDLEQARRSACGISPSDAENSVARASLNDLTVASTRCRPTRWLSRVAPGPRCRHASEAARAPTWAQGTACDRSPSPCAAPAMASHAGP